VLLVCVAWTLVLLFPARRALLWLAVRTGSLAGDGPSPFFMTATMLLAFGSAFFTDIVGVHAIFGAFLAGLVVPRENGLAVRLTEKLEDMVAIVFLPLYFTLSGLSTDLGLLNNGITWGFTVAICTLAYSGKFGGCTLAARYAGFSWREASTIGSLMSCKGCVSKASSCGCSPPRVSDVWLAGWSSSSSSTSASPPASSASASSPCSSSRRSCSPS
jgi:Kef-type K+ transport system membrane component KefB